MQRTPEAVVASAVPGIAVPTEPVEELAPPRSKKKLGVGGWLALIWVVGIGLAAILAPLLPIPEPTEIFPAIARKGPTAGHLLGGDSTGRDVLSRIIYGARASYLVGFGAVAFGMVIGGTIGLMAGFFRGRFDAIATPAMNVFLAIPQFVLALSLVTVLASQDGVTGSRRLVVVILGLGIVSVPLLGRITRANTLTWSEREFVLAARAMGAKSGRIMFREVLPNVLPAMLSIALLAVGIAIVAEGGLSLFGAGVQLPTPSWGNMIAAERSQMRTAPHTLIFTSIVLFLTVLALNFLGDVVRERFDVRESVL